MGWRFGSTIPQTHSRVLKPSERVSAAEQRAETANRQAETAEQIAEALEAFNRQATAEIEATSAGVRRLVRQRAGWGE